MGKGQFWYIGSDKRKKNKSLGVNISFSQSASVLPVWQMSQLYISSLSLHSNIYGNLVCVCHLESTLTSNTLPEKFYFKFSFLITFDKHSWDQRGEKIALLKNHSAAFGSDRFAFTAFKCKMLFRKLWILLVMWMLIGQAQTSYLNSFPLPSTAHPEGMSLNQRSKASHHNLHEETTHTGQSTNSSPKWSAFQQSGTSTRCNLKCPKKKKQVQFNFIYTILIYVLYLGYKTQCILIEFPMCLFFRIVVQKGSGRTIEII